MSATSDLLFEYLKSIFYASAEAKLDLEKLEEDYVVFGKGLIYFAHCFSQYNEFANALARGDLSVHAPPPENELAAPLKSLHSNLKHLTWQSKQVASGDYKQRVDFMGEFSDAFNTMVKQLADRQKSLENEIEQGRKHVAALEQGSKLLKNVTRYIPQQLLVIREDNHEVLLLNDMAERELETDPSYLERLMAVLPVHKDNRNYYNFEIMLEQAGAERYLSVSSYLIEWENVHAVALVINDISVEKRQIKELESHAYRDELTNLYNRFFGMLTLNEWIGKKMQFALIFVDMDNLKYINDRFGHGDGDRYIMCVARCLSAFSQSAAVCRIGGDEFMMLVPDTTFDQANERMNDIQTLIQNDEYLEGKEYSYSVSYGIVAVDEQNEMPSSVILSTADERMYEHKRARKKERQTQAAPA
jgi:diguanylate cyclase (GGDEF)-like protein